MAAPRFSAIPRGLPQPNPSIDLSLSARSSNSPNQDASDMKILHTILPNGIVATDESALPHQPELTNELVFQTEHFDVARLSRTSQYEHFCGVLCRIQEF